MMSTAKLSLVVMFTVDIYICSYIADIINEILEK